MTQTTKEEFAIKFNFEKPEEMSQGTENDFINLIIWGAGFFKTVTGQPLFREPALIRMHVPNLMSETVLVKAVESSAKAA